MDSFIYVPPCKICSEGQSTVCKACYGEKDRQVNDLLTTVRQLKACINLAKSEIDLALLGGEK